MEPQRVFIIYFFDFFCDLLILYQRVRAVLPKSARQDDILLMVFATLLKSFVSSTSRNVAAGLQKHERKTRLERATRFCCPNRQSKQHSPPRRGAARVPDCLSSLPPAHQQPAHSPHTGLPVHQLVQRSAQSNAQQSPSSTANPCASRVPIDELPTPDHQCRLFSGVEELRRHPHHALPKA